MVSVLNQAEAFFFSKLLLGYHSQGFKDDLAERLGKGLGRGLDSSGLVTREALLEGNLYEDFFIAKGANAALKKPRVSGTTLRRFIPSFQQN